MIDEKQAALLARASYELGAGYVLRDLLFVVEKQCRVTDSTMVILGQLQAIIRKKLEEYGG